MERAPSGGFCPRTQRKHSPLSSGLQACQVAASDVTVCLGLQRYPCQYPGGTSHAHTWPFMVAGMTQQANRVKSVEQGLAEEACRLRYSEEVILLEVGRGSRLRSFDGEKVSEEE